MKILIVVTITIISAQIFDFSEGIWIIITIYTLYASTAVLHDHFPCLLVVESCKNIPNDKKKRANQDVYTVYMQLKEDLKHRNFCQCNHLLSY